MPVLPFSVVASDGLPAFNSTDMNTEHTDASPLIKFGTHLANEGQPLVLLNAFDDDMEEYNRRQPRDRDIRHDLAFPWPQLLHSITNIDIGKWIRLGARSKECDFQWTDQHKTGAEGKVMGSAAWTDAIYSTTSDKYNALAAELGLSIEGLPAPLTDFWFTEVLHALYQLLSWESAQLLLAYKEEQMHLFGDDVTFNGFSCLNVQMETSELYDHTKPLSRAAHWVAVRHGVDTPADVYAETVSGPRLEAIFDLLAEGLPGDSKKYTGGYFCSEKQNLKLNQQPVHNTSYQTSTFGDAGIFEGLISVSAMTGSNRLQPDMWVRVS
jgi:hypothetical protein